MEKFNLKNNKAAIVAEVKKDGIEVSIYDAILDTSEIYTLTPIEAIKLARWLSSAAVYLASKEPAELNQVPVSFNSTHG